MEFDMLHFLHYPTFAHKFPFICKILYYPIFFKIWFEYWGDNCIMKNDFLEYEFNAFLLELNCTVGD